ncbi:S-adenosyl-L-methionine-dependent methyltransferase [Cladochytrium replicatum]|nr:S-adenosyl-L-methionine-dependent methyltransferase [Cladochytrium replicatum]
MHKKPGEPDPAPPLDVDTYYRYDSVGLSKTKEHPYCSRTRVRDFIHNSLYNPHYGYFSKQAYIFSPPEPIPFNDIKDSYHFTDHLSDMYKDIEGEYSEYNDISRQVWHTPTELFRPWYGYAVASYILSEFRRDPRGSDKLIIYEMGAGNGTLMLNIMDFIREHDPEVFSKTFYNIIEISTALAGKQTANHELRAASRQHPRVNIINKSIFDWTNVENSPCFFLAMEVLDNFAHDVVRYNYATGEPYQGVVLTDEHGDYSEAYETLSDPLIQRFLTLRGLATGVSAPTLSASWRRNLRLSLPFAPNMSEPEFIPTMSLRWLETLKTYFPRSRLVASDFFKLPDAVPGYNGPVVQTRHKGTMIPCSTYLVQPGWFDIFFPTDFEQLRAMYDQLVRNGNEAGTQVVSHQTFLESYANLNATRTKSGENPMLSFYENVKFILS